MAWGWEAAEEIDELIVVGVWEPGLKGSSFDVIPIFIYRRRHRGWLKG